MLNSTLNHKLPDWHPVMLDNQQRWMNFLDKLEDKMQALCEAAIPELQQIHKDDPDIYKRAYGKLLAGVQGQLHHIMEKIRDVEEEKIHGFIAAHDADTGRSSLDWVRLQDILLAYRHACLERRQAFELVYQDWQRQLVQTGQRDLEAEYQQILDEYAQIKDRFTCQQCGGPIAISKIYFLTTYLTCSHCQTKNTFEPSAQARRLEDLGRSLAEQRTKHLLEAYQEAQQEERRLYFQMHENRLQRAEHYQELNRQLEQARKQVMAQAASQYEIYLRAMFDEWNSIVPDLKPQNEKFYHRLLNDFRKSI